MGQITVAAIINFFSATEFEIATAIFAQKIERTITEKAIITIAIRYHVARKILAFKVAEKSVTIFHIISSMTADNKLALCSLFDTVIR